MPELVLPRVCGATHRRECGARGVRAHLDEREADVDRKRDARVHQGAAVAPERRVVGEQVVGEALLVVRVHVVDVVVDVLRRRAAGEKTCSRLMGFTPNRHCGEG